MKFGHYISPAGLFGFCGGGTDLDFMKDLASLKNVTDIEAYDLTGPESHFKAKKC